jgi:hypothetical protein
VTWRSTDPNSWNPLYRLGRHAIEHWPEYLELLQSPLPYAGLAAGAAGSYGAIRGARAAKGYLSERPGDIVFGRRIGGRWDGLFRHDVVAGWRDRTHHVEMMGPTGSGKTTALLPMAVQDLLRGHAVLVEEIYGDFATRLVPYAIALGRPLFVFDCSLPGSLCLNPLSGGDDETVVERFASTVKGLFSYHEFYGPFNGDAARAFARLAREYARSVGGEADLALLGLLITDRDFLYRVLQVEGEGKGREYREWVGARGWISRETRSWFDSDYLRWGEDIHVRYLMGLKNWVRELLATEAARRSLCPGPHDRLLDLEAAIATRGALIVLRMPVEAVNAEPARAIARFATRTIQDLTLRRLADGAVAPPLALYLDELPTLVGRAHGDAQTTAEWMALVRKQNVCVTVAYQGGHLMGDVLAGAVDTSARTKLFGPGLGAEDALRAQTVLGYEEREVTDERVTSRGPLDPHATRSEGRRTARAPRVGEEELRFSKIGDWNHLPFRDLEQRPPERLRISPVPPPDRFLRRAAA